MNSEQWAEHMRKQREAQARVAPTRRERMSRSYGTVKVVSHDVPDREKTR